MSNNRLFILVLFTIIITAAVTLIINKDSSKLTRAEIDTAVNQAKFLYREEKAKGRDFSEGPCLSDALLPNWVVDVAHNPRQSRDDLPQNQCPSFREGKLKHFVELDPDGNLIKAQ